MVTKDAHLNALISRFAMVLYHHATTTGNCQYVTLNAGSKVVHVRLTDGGAGMFTLIDVFALSRIKAHFPEWENVAILVIEECFCCDNGTELSEFGQTFWLNMVKDMGVAVDKNQWLLDA
ncbi:UNVERIFIED_ORG: hypothetical protein J2Y78_004146 [Buttiauxella agrestis ATCC 33320]